MKTKILILFLAIAPLAARAQFTFTTSSGVITITGYNPAAGLNVIIPDSTNGYPVTAIETSAFYFLTTITNVTIPASVTNIGDSAFAGCRGLTSVTFGNSVTSIGKGAFELCSSLTSVTIPNSVTSIGDGAFYFCSGLTSVTIPNSVTNLGSAPFEGCPVTSIAVEAANPSYASLGGVLFDRALATLIECPGGLAGSYVVTNSVTSIGESAFGFCNGLTSVTIPNSVTNIGEDAFGICDGLTNIAVNATNSHYASVAGVLFDKSLDTLLQFPGGLAGSYAIPNSVTSIGEAAFEICPGLTSVTIPDSVTSIGGFAFNDCRRLTSVTIGNRVTSIGDEAFSHASLTSVTIPNSVTNIGEAAFEYCTSLQAYFQGNAPLVDGAAGSTDSTVFLRDSATAYYLPGATGWSSTFGGLHTALWYQPAPVILGGPGLGVQGNQFGFTISWATNASVVVEAATNLANPVWIPVSANTLTGGTNYFSDPQWTNYPMRFYRAALAFTVGGTLTGLPAGDTITLQDNGSDNLTLSANGPFTFPTALPNGQSYSVTGSGTGGGTLTTYTTGTITVNGSGTISGTNVTNVAVRPTGPVLTGDKDLDMLNAAVADGTANGGVPAVMYTENGGPFRVTAPGTYSYDVSLRYYPWSQLAVTVGNTSCSSTTFPSGTPVIQFGTALACGQTFGYGY